MDPISEKIYYLRELSKSLPKEESKKALLLACRILKQAKALEEPEIEVDESEYPVQDDAILFESEKRINWKLGLASLVSRHFGCLMIDDLKWSVNSPHNQISRIRLIGRRQDLESTRVVFLRLAKTIENNIALLFNKKQKMLRKSYAEGCVAGIRLQLSRIKTEVRTEAKLHGRMVELADLSSRAVRSREFLETRFENAVSCRFRSTPGLNVEVFSAGVEEGEKMILHPFINGMVRNLLK